MNRDSQQMIVGPLGGLRGLGVKPEGSYVTYLLGLFDASKIQGVEDGARLGSWLNHGTADLELRLNTSDGGGWQRYRGGASPSVEFDDQSFTAVGDDYDKENLLLRDGETNIFFRFRATDQDARLHFKQGPHAYHRRTFEVLEDRLRTSVRGYQGGPSTSIRTPNNFDGTWHGVRIHVAESGDVTFYRDGKRLATDTEHGSSNMQSDRRGNNELTAKNMQISMIATASVLNENQIEAVQRDQVGGTGAGGLWPWLALLGVGGAAYLLGRGGSGQTTVVQPAAKKPKSKKNSKQKSTASQHSKQKKGTP